MRKWILAMAFLAMGLTSAQASGPFSVLRDQHQSNSKPVLPVFQAAPWYLYWPYDAHFMTPAPMQGAFYPPPGVGAYGNQPYFPASPMNQYPGTPMQIYPR